MTAMYLMRLDGWTVINSVLEFFSFRDFFSIIKKFFYESVLMKVGEGEAARTNLGEISTTNPFFPLTGPSIGGAKVLSTTSLVNE